MKRLFALLLALVMVFSLFACGKKTDNTDNTGASQAAGNNNDEETEWTYIHVENTGNFQVEELVTGTGMNAVATDILNNDDLIDPDKFGGKTIEIYGYSGSFYENIEENWNGLFYFMVRAAIDEWAYQNNVTVKFLGGYDQGVILGDINSGGHPDLLLYSNKFPLPASTGITRAFTDEEYEMLSKTAGSYYLDMMNYKGKSYGVQVPWSGGSLLYYNETAYETYGVKSPADYFMEDNWTWETYETAITQIARDTDGDGTKDLYGTGSIFNLIPDPMMRRLKEDGTVESLLRTSDKYMRYLDMYYKALKETKITGKYATSYIATSPRPAVFIGDAEWYNFAHVYRELVNGDIIRCVPVPQYDKNDPYYYLHTLVHMGIMSSCDENEATIALMNYILRCGMRYISDYSLGLFKCNYEGVRGASPYAGKWKQLFAELVEERQTTFDALSDWDQELYQKMQDTVLSGDTVHYIGYTFPGEDMDPTKNHGQGSKPAATLMPEIAAAEEAWMKTYNELYAK